MKDKTKWERKVWERRCSQPYPPAISENATLQPHPGRLTGLNRQPLRGLSGQALSDFDVRTP
jgi:hypothetical protein